MQRDALDAERSADAIAMCSPILISGEHCLHNLFYTLSRRPDPCRWASPALAGHHGQRLIPPRVEILPDRGWTPPASPLRPVAILSAAGPDLSRKERSIRPLACAECAAIHVICSSCSARPICVGDSASASSRGSAFWLRFCLCAVLNNNTLSV
jgi:hypothetical protein